MLKAAGVTTPLDIDLWYMPVQRPYNPNAKRIAEMMQADLAKVGVNAKLVSYEWGEYRKRLQGGEHHDGPARLDRRQRRSRQLLLPARLRLRRASAARTSPSGATRTLTNCSRRRAIDHRPGRRAPRCTSRCRSSSTRRRRLPHRPFGRLRADAQERDRLQVSPLGATTSKASTSSKRGGTGESAEGRPPPVCVPALVRSMLRFILPASR